MSKREMSKHITLMRISRKDESTVARSESDFVERRFNLSYFIPASSRISLVQKFVWHPAPFQFPGIGLGSKDAIRPKSSHTRCRMNRAIHR